jgi:hypothetical protein
MTFFAYLSGNATKRPPESAGHVLIMKVYGDRGRKVGTSIVNEASVKGW